MRLTYPEQHTFNWEEKERLPMFLAIEIFKKQAKSGTSVPRRMTYSVAVQALEDIQHQHDPSTISTKKLKELLIAAAQEHGWYPLDRSQIKQKPDPLVPDGMKYCRKCKEVYPKDSFVAVVSAAKAAHYGWPQDTNRTHLAHLCKQCRSGQQKEKARKRAKRDVLRHKFTDAQLRENPALEKRVHQYHKLHAHLKIHAARVRAAFSNVKRVLHFPEGDAYEYQFATEDLRKFYESKRVLVKAARDRLEDMFGEDAPLPDTWGMLLTREEQVELANLHADAVLSCNASKQPALWNVQLPKKKHESEE